MSAWLNGLSPVRREQVLMGAGLAVLALIFVLIWSTLGAQREPLRARVAQRQATLAYLQTAVPRLLDEGSPSRAAPAGADESLLVVVDKTIRAEGLSQALSRAEPDGDTRVRVWLDHARFDRVAAWLERLAGKFGIVAGELSVDRAGVPGRVNARVLLVRK